MHHRSWIELSRSALRSNVQQTQKLIGRQTQIMPILKANAYGHGMIEVARVLNGLSIWGMGVAYGSEALLLRAAKYRGRILVLSYWQPSELSQLATGRVDIAVWNIRSLKLIQQLPTRVRRQVRVHIKLDTGTTRLGFLPEEISQLRHRLEQQPVHIEGVFSHFANSEEASPDRTQGQLKRFTTLMGDLALTQGTIKHIACTAAGLRYPEARFDLLRLGIGLFGIWPSSSVRQAVKRKLPSFQLRPVAVWKSLISQVKTVSADTSIGYGGSYRTKRRTTVGIVPVGYADGYDRRLSNRGWVMIHAQRAPILGRVCMNVMMVDLTNIPQVRLGDEVTLLGQGMSADTMAELCKTISYEVTTRISPELPRLLVRS